MLSFAEVSIHSLNCLQSQIYTYPIKSIRGTTATTLLAGYRGFAHDRSFMLVRASDKQNMQISRFPEMCLFTTEIVDSKILIRYTKDHVFDHPEQKLKDAGSTLEIELEPSTSALDSLELTMYSSPTTSYDMGSSPNTWFSERFGYSVKLLYIGSHRRKPLGNLPPSVAARQREGLQGSTLTTNEPNNSAKSWLGSITSTATSMLSSVTTGNRTYPGVDEGISFADCAPYLIISSKSWEQAQSRLDPPSEALDITKFRPNIIVEGAESAYEEDYWGELEILPSASNSPQQQPLKMVLTQNCVRCASLNVDYDTGKFGTGEAGKMLKKLQGDRRVDPGAKWSPVFGRYGFLDRVEGADETVPVSVSVSVGDEVRIVRRNESRTKFGE